jgi:hypothetical protein
MYLCDKPLGFPVPHPHPRVFLRHGLQLTHSRTGPLQLGRFVREVYRGLGLYRAVRLARRPSKPTEEVQQLERRLR